MTEPGADQTNPSDPAPKPSGIEAAPASPAGEAAGRIQKCPHCARSIAAIDAAGGKCWFCNKRFTDPVEPPRPRPPFLATFLLGLVGAVLGTVFGLVLLGEKIGSGSWTLSLCGGIGLATGSAVARAIFGHRK